MALRFNESYLEQITLADGQRLLFRSIRPADKPRFVEGMQRLSPSSRFSRFFAAKTSLSEAELRYLTEVDGTDHYALGAAVLNDDGSEGTGVAVGRFVRSRRDPEIAEPAIVVMDEWQGKGIGRMILQRLVAASLERGIRFFRAEYLAENLAIQKLFEQLCPTLRVTRHGTTVVAIVPLFDITLPSAGPCDPAGAANPLHELLRMAAKRLIRLRPRT
jgi:GNAT superfamily N-acetyltransferase